MNFFDQEALDYFYEELGSYYDEEEEQGEIYDGYDFQHFLISLIHHTGAFAPSINIKERTK